MSKYVLYKVTKIIFNLISLLPRLLYRWRHICREVFCSSWRERWFFLKDTCFGYIDPSNGITKCVVLYDQGFEVSSGIYSTGLQKAFQVVTFSRQLVIKCSTRSHRNEFLQSLKLHAAELGSKNILSPDV